MRRFVLPFAVAVAAALAACSGGGSVLSTGGSAAHVIITDANQSGNTQPGTFFVRQSAATPLRLHAQAVTGSTNGVVGGLFTWVVSAAVSGVNASGGPTASNISCSQLTVVPAPQPSPTKAPIAFGYVVPASSLVVDPQDTSFATFVPPAIPPPPTGFAYANQTYCVNILATTGSTTGSVVVVVSNP